MPETTRCRYCRQPKSSRGIRTHEQFCEANPNRRTTLIAPKATKGRTGPAVPPKTEITPASNAALFIAHTRDTAIEMRKTLELRKEQINAELQEIEGQLDLLRQWETPGPFESLKTAA